MKTLFYSLRALSVLGALCVSAGASLRPQAVPVSYAGARSPFEAEVDLARPERERIRAHLARVEADLRAHPPAGLSEARRAARAARLDDLRAYAERGEFPRNRDYPDRLVPYFIDAEGVPCAMGHLVIASGHADFAEEIHENRNNAYIPEIAAADGRLARWLEANGMTLEEAARVQPSYGPPSLYSVLSVGLDSLGRVWAFGGDQNSIGNVALLRREGTKWTSQGGGFGAAGFCLTRGGDAAVLQSESRVTWKGTAYGASGTSSRMMSACAWDSAQQSLWVGTGQGLRRFTRGGAFDTLAVRSYTTTLTPDTVLAVAATGSAVWAGTPRGLSRRGFRGGDTLVATWDSAALQGARVTGLRASGGDKVWAGLEGSLSEARVLRFSTLGLRRWDGAQWRTYRAAMSSVQLPGDTIYALAVRDTATVWIATPSGFHRFPSTGSPKVADLPAGAVVNDMVGDAQGFYAATNLGVYRYADGVLTFMGQPAVSLRGGVAGKPTGPAPRLRVLTRAEAAAEAAGRLHTLSGRQVSSGAAQGVYLPDAPR